MTKFSRSYISNVFAVLLIVLLFQGSSTWVLHPEEGIIKDKKEDFTAALEEYKNGFFERAAERLEMIPGLKEELEPGFKAKVYLLLGACFEKLKNEEKARTCFLQLKELLDKQLIKQVPAVEGIDPEDFTGYREVFAGSSFFTHNEPISVSDMMKKNVVYAPRKSVEEKEKEKKRKKFPWLIAVGAAFVIGVTVVLLLTQKDSNKKSEFTEVEWVTIPAGEFLMGDNFNEGDADEQPVHPVYLDEYSISKYEITTAQYNWFCDEAGRKKLTVVIPPYTEYTGKYPATNVSYFDAVAFCNWLSQRTGKNVHLPTEAQWEKAARSTQQYRYPWGNSEPDCGKAQYNECLDNDLSLGGKVPVSFFDSGASPYEVNNMSGNVWEWCQDWYSESYYSVSPQNNPPGPAAGAYRVIRGGGCYSIIHEIRSANRDYFGPAYYWTDIGFRVVMEDR